MPRFIRELSRSKLAVVGLCSAMAVVAMAVAAEWVPAYDAGRANIAERLRAPSLPAGAGGHVLGTDALGRDVLARVVRGARLSLVVGGAAAMVSAVLGVVLGLLAGYYGGRIDALIMRIADIQMAFPLILLAITVIAVLGPGLLKLIVVLGVSRWVAYARVVRGQVLVQRTLEFVLAARALGASDARILWRHVLPNVQTSIIVVTTFTFSSAILTESTLSFLGLGVQPSIPTWGRMLAEGREYLREAWWLTTFPGLALMAAVLGANALGDWLRDYLDPRLRL
ncbi:MAG: ABC transporter permease [Armatimonadetes bacterium]|nr:ABC transporter permease [Armatimonadota bacterium]